MAASEKSRQEDSLPTSCIVTLSAKPVWWWKYSAELRQACTSCARRTPPKSLCAACCRPSSHCNLPGLANPNYALCTRQNGRRTAAVAGHGADLRLLPQRMLVKLLHRDDHTKRCFSITRKRCTRSAPANPKPTMPLFCGVSKSISPGTRLCADARSRCRNRRGSRCRSQLLFSDREGPLSARGLGKTVYNYWQNAPGHGGDDYADPVTQQQSKMLMRTLINHYLGGESLHTRQLLIDLQQL